mmetsp:Transcript_17266/g.41614  ORF Transcript_17266/g.41614 Transcript_17266/m.41614 type:complete len:224 (-) Transcript_17266:80-751(-)
MASLLFQHKRGSPYVVGLFAVGNLAPRRPGRARDLAAYSRRDSLPPLVDTCLDSPSAPSSHRSSQSSHLASPSVALFTLTPCIYYQCDGLVSLFRHGDAHLCGGHWRQPHHVQERIGSIGTYMARHWNHIFFFKAGLHGGPNRLRSDENSKRSSAFFMDFSLCVGEAASPWVGGSAIGDCRFCQSAEGCALFQETACWRPGGVRRPLAVSVRVGGRQSMRYSP